MTKPIEQLVIQLGNALKEREWKLATAESCTGGGLAYFITSIAGSSDWFERGFVTYSNTSKEELVNVRNSTLDTFGAVSEQTAREMAEGALQHSQAQVSMAITGIAGPTGGSADKPVGTVWFAWSGIHTETQTFVHRFPGDRNSIREQSIATALEKLLMFIKANATTIK